MIEYVEIRNKDREVIGIVDTAESVIWHAEYYGTGDFELHAAFTPELYAMLQPDYFITRPDSDDVGIIERIEVDTDDVGKSTITASGRFAKSALDRAHIIRISTAAIEQGVQWLNLSPVMLSGKVEDAVRGLVRDHLINHEILDISLHSAFALGQLCNAPEIIVDANGVAAEKQVTCENLLDYTDGLLQEYRLGAHAVLGADRKLYYTVMRGKDCSAQNTEGNNPVIFSREYDNLVSSSWSYDTSRAKTAVLIGGEGEGIERFYGYMLDRSQEGYTGPIGLRETFVDAKHLRKTYREDDEDKTYTNVEYSKLLYTYASQKIEDYKVVETFTGQINPTFGVWRLGRDYGLGDIVTLQDNQLGKYVNVRITEITEVQDEDGYSIEAKYASE